MEDTLFTKESLKEAISTIGDASFTLIYDANELESQLSAGRELQQAEWILATIADHVYDYYPVSYFMNEDGKKEYPEFREWFLSHTEVGVKNAIRFVSNNFSVLETVTRDEYNQHRIPRRDLDKENHVKAVLEEVARNINYFTNYFAWPIYLNMTKTHESDFEHSRVSIVKIEAPDECPPDSKDTFIAPTTPENNYLWAKSLSKMRGQMENNSDARIILGGRTHGFKGKYAGILEEYLIAKNKGNPIYLLGGFGGVSKIIADMLEEKLPESHLSDQANIDASYSDFVSYYNTKENSNPINYQAIFSDISHEGIASLNNGLSEDENKILFQSTNILEIVALVLKGLNNKFKTI